jgi:apolipoprotein N-acyltransferase
LVNDIVNNGINFLTIQTNDGWLGNSIGPIQHYNISKIRAIENRIPIVRSGNNGVSGMILPNGISINEKPLGVTSVFEVSVPIVQPGSIYSQNGNIFVIFCLILSLLILLWSLRKSI